MCGIAGFLATGGFSNDGASIARAMGDALRHRGPDDRGEWVDPPAGIALSHRRLSIVDLSAAGRQPMQTADGRWVIVYNGEIYNHLDMREQLERAGSAPAWRGHSDTETLLAAIVAWGVTEALRRAVGMFALALWDRDARALTLARDRLGEKPLYYGVQSGALLFGSELKALRAHRTFAAPIDRGALSLLLRYGYVPSPWSIYSGIRKLPPGTTLTLRQPGDAEAGPVPYWSMREAALTGASDPLHLSDGEAVAELDRLLRQSIAGQRMADVPLGAFLSGGIDSSTTVAVMQALSSQPVRTFTLGFAEAAYDESAHARVIASHLGTSHTELTVTPAEARNAIPQLPAIFCEPFADASQIPTFLVSQLARRDVSVSLSGDGGDELFGGYERYHWAQRIAAVPLTARRALGAALQALPAEAWSALLAPAAPLLPRALREGHRADRLRKLSAVLRSTSDDSLYEQLVSFWPHGGSPVLGGIEPPTAFGETPASIEPFAMRMMMVDLHTYLPDDILVKVDRAAMAVSLETRVPLLDHRIVEFALRLPQRFKFRDGQSKWLLRQMLDRYVPRAMVERPKMGFGIPIHDWLLGPLRDWAETLLAEPRLREAGLLDSVPIRRLWAEHLNRRNDWGYRLWPILMFEAWRAAVGTAPAAGPSIAC
jgi:asparagine synthase (glutamine-hydrolysing)